ncbi:pentapeptide repeat-containing protein [Pedobacter xixiisoli]|uniref:Uncharacterized protein YjbI, contains pentapeptide repeats n=1 Tax=Pedobacter xixiisoli TaxID=1476464 RepID=A0A286A7X8_9SPHI|nr:pentapeptide repeat-containing protein [Pedobacter xixiisoli]SOD18014.1 Uncharacterized protein YjbI, contains pentapeptide repeats [Pedobacter xixiisoli]
MAQEEIYYDDRVFSEADILEKGRRTTHFNNCTFKKCDFSEVDFRSCNFTNCEFDGCNLSMVKFNDTGLDNVNFKNSKLVGTDFSVAKDFLFSVNFTDCILDYSTFVKKKNKKAKFIGCSLKGTDFSEADLTLAIFKRCDLSGTVFMRTILAQANLSEAYNFSIDPEQNNIRKALFSNSGLSGLLHKYDIVVA